MILYNPYHEYIVFYIVLFSWKFKIKFTLEIFFSAYSKSWWGVRIWSLYGLSKLAWAANLLRVPQLHHEDLFLCAIAEKCYSASILVIFMVAQVTEIFLAFILCCRTIWKIMHFFREIFKFCLQKIKKLFLKGKELLCCVLNIQK